MNANSTKLLAVALSAVALSSCGAKFDTKTFSTEDVSYYGKHKEYVKIVDESCVFKFNPYKKYYKPSMTVTFELVEEVEPSDNYEAMYGNIDIKFVDADGGSIDVDGLTPDGTSEYNKLEELLAGEVGDQVKVTFAPMFTSMNKEEAEMINTNAVSFEVNDLEFSEIYTVSSSDSSSSDSSSSSSNWDSILDDYEEYVDDYIALLNKANSGDISAMTDAISMMENAQSLSDKLDDAGDLSSAEMSRYSQIAQKLTNAAMSAL